MVSNDSYMSEPLKKMEFSGEAGQAMTPTSELEKGEAHQSCQAQ